MNYEDYRAYILTCEYLGKEPTGQYKRIHDFLTGMWYDMEIVVNSQNNRIIIQKEEGWFIERDLEYGYLWCNQGRVWSFFRSDMDIEPTEIEDFAKSMVEEHLKCEVEAPHVGRGGNLIPVKQHLQCEVGTPFVKCMEDDL